MIWFYVNEEKIGHTECVDTWTGLMSMTKTRLYSFDYEIPEEGRIPIIKHYRNMTL